MTTELVLLADVPAMTLCSICPDPGHCCRSFKIYTQDNQEVTIWIDELDTETKKRLPFVPSVISKPYKVADETDPNHGREYVSVEWSCPHLTAPGRCGIYLTRPEICRRFVPGDQSTLCVFHPDNVDARAAFRLKEFA